MLASDSCTSPSLIVRIRQRDQQAWEELVHLYGPLVYRWGEQAGLQAADAANLVQEVFRGVAKSIASFRHDPQLGRFRGWLWSITRNKLMDHHRKLSRQPLAFGGSRGQSQLHNLEDINDASDGSAEAPPTELADFLSAIEACRHRFRDNTWRAFWATTVDERCPGEVADELGMSREAVHTAKCRVLARLRQHLDENEITKQG